MKPSWDELAAPDQSADFADRADSAAVRRYRRHRRMNGDAAYWFAYSSPRATRGWKAFSTMRMRLKLPLAWMRRP